MLPAPSFVLAYYSTNSLSSGIQARTITGQASSEFSHKYFQNTRDYLDGALVKMGEIEAEKGSISKL